MNRRRNKTFYSGNGERDIFYFVLTLISYARLARPRGLWARGGIPVKLELELIRALGSEWVKINVSQAF